MSYRTIKIRIPSFEAAEPGKKGADDPFAAAATVRSYMHRENVPWDREVFGILALNARGKVMGAHTVSIGTLSSTLVHPREVFRPALALGAAAIIAWHTHPSGELEPSNEDEKIARRLVSAGEILGVPVIDNLIVTHEGFRSLGGGVA